MPLMIREPAGFLPYKNRWCLTRSADHRETVLGMAVPSVKEHRIGSR